MNGGKGRLRAPKGGEAMEFCGLLFALINVLNSVPVGTLADIIYYAEMAVKNKRRPINKE